MNILSLLNFLDSELQKGNPMPLTGKVLVDRDKCLDIVAEIRLAIPEDIKQAQALMKEKKQILMDAEKQSEVMLLEAEDKIRQMVNEHEITQKAYTQAQEIINNAQRNAREIRLGANAYADEVLSELESYVKEQSDMIRQNHAELRHADTSGQ